MNLEQDLKNACSALLKGVNELQVENTELRTRLEMAERRAAADNDLVSTLTETSRRANTRIANFEKIVRSLERHVDPAVFARIFTGDWRTDPLPEIDFVQAIQGF